MPAGNLAIWNLLSRWEEVSDANFEARKHGRTHRLSLASPAELVIAAAMSYLAL